MLKNVKKIRTIDLNREVVINFTIEELSILGDGIWQGINHLEEEIEDYHPIPNPRSIFLKNRIEELKSLYEKIGKSKR
ncbi:MAG: hypothetical protein ACK5L7_01480 [Paludibacteraceae bacterium]